MQRVLGSPSHEDIDLSQEGSDLVNFYNSSNFISDIGLTRDQASILHQRMTTGFIGPNSFLTGQILNWSDNTESDENFYLSYMHEYSKTRIFKNHIISPKHITKTKMDHMIRILEILKPNKIKDIKDYFDNVADAFGKNDKLCGVKFSEMSPVIMNEINDAYFKRKKTKIIKKCRYIINEYAY